MIYKYEHPEYFKDLPPVNYKDYDGNIVLFGAGMHGAMAARLLEKQGVKIICFADNNPKKWGTKYLGYPIISPEEMRECYFNAAIIITPTAIRPIYEQVKEMGFQTILPGLFLFLEFDTADVQDVLPEFYFEKKIDTPMIAYMRLQAEFYCLGAGALKVLNVIVTERCTLRCKECLFFMPYYKNPRDYDWDGLKKSLSRLLEHESFHFVLVEGGEIFLYKKLPELLEMLISSPQIERIIPVTNGTIIPNKQTLELLKNPKIDFRISNYGEHSHRLGELVDLLKLEGVPFFVKRPFWQRLAEICPPYFRSDEEVQDTFFNCCKFSGGPFLVDGKLYKCAFAANACNLGVIPKSYRDIVDLLSEPYDGEKMKEQINQLYKRENFIEACRYCRGRGWQTEQVPVAEQMVGVAPELPNYRKGN